jgi:hypothetical protein
MFPLCTSLASYQCGSVNRLDRKGKYENTRSPDIGPMPKGVGLFGVMNNQVAQELIEALQVMVQMFEGKKMGPYQRFAIEQAKAAIPKG